MTQDNVIIKCAGCGTKNRVPKGRLHERPKCGRCGSPLKFSEALEFLWM